MDEPMINPPCLADNFLQWGCFSRKPRKRMRSYEVETGRPDPKNYREKKSMIRTSRHLVRAEREPTTLLFEEHHNHQKQGKSKESILIPQVKTKSKKSILIPSERKLSHNQVKIKSIFKSADHTGNNKKNFGSSPEKGTRLHPLSNGVCTRNNNIDETDKISGDGAAIQDKATDLGTFVWPKFHLTLSHSEKEEDFQAMKSAKLPLRPKKRTKLVQKTIHSVSPGSWLGDLSQDRYQVREKKSAKKRTKGLKAMQSVDSDLE